MRRFGFSPWITSETQRMFVSVFLLLLQRRLSRAPPPRVTHDLSHSWFDFQQFSRSGNGANASSRWQNENRPLSDDKQTFPKKNLKHSVKTDETSCSSCASSERKWQRQTKQRDREELRTTLTSRWVYKTHIPWCGIDYESTGDQDSDSDPVMLWMAAFRTSPFKVSVLMGNYHYT